MTTADWTGALGVGILLLAFLLNLSGRLHRDSRPYAAMNALGAGIAGVAAAMIGFLPFVVLEGVWCLASVVALTRPGARASA